MNSEHGTTLTKATYDSEVDASYFGFCDCKIVVTKDYTEKTAHEVLVDISHDEEHGDHISGVELLSFSVSEPLTVSLKKVEGLTDEQTALILEAVKNHTLKEY